MKSIVRRDTGEDWNDVSAAFDARNRKAWKTLRTRSFAASIGTRKDKRVSNEEWMSKTDPDSRIAKMKDGRTHLAYKAEHVVDLETEVVLAASIYHADDARRATRWSTA